jgi:hypothetical protein
MVSDVAEFHCDGVDFRIRHRIGLQWSLMLTATTARYTHLRDYLEHCPLPCNNNAPLNPNGERRYLIIISHCHYGKPNPPPVAKASL